MTTIKSHTDLNQSKKLAEILPLESADMLFQLGEDKYVDSIRVPLTKKHWKKMMPDINPCWSLAALLSVLDFPSLTQNKEDEWEVCVPNCESDGYIKVSADNPIDACYEMILKLNELNLL
jgi:hypothetical protein